MAAYSRVSYEERVEIYGGWLAGTSVRGIARRLKRQPSTISRELRRCREDTLGYRPELAEEHAGRRLRLNPGLFTCRKRRRHVRDRLRDGWSPEQIAGRLRRDGSPLYVCKESIYQWVYRKQNHKLRLYSWLPYGKKSRKKPTGSKRPDRIPNATPIALRPQEIALRSTFGHWEGETVKKGTSEGADADKRDGHQDDAGFWASHGDYFRSPTDWRIDRALSPCS